ncbi:hypothetical protein EVAR_71593_1 [Eumeta japonica]|uniref:Uncharacterized protein n=1 Tax=Eumeta variegata TaxID=151549 RepID=A0A4C1SVX4_EUMVA|nr:hypothetical protein EVAR_71593_1 [Eumeta japonica]
MSTQWHSEHASQCPPLIYGRHELEELHTGRYFIAGGWSVGDREEHHQNSQEQSFRRIRERIRVIEASVKSRLRISCADQIGNVINEGHIMSTGNRRAHMKRLMGISEPRYVCKDRGVWRYVVSANPSGRLAIEKLRNDTIKPKRTEMSAKVSIEWVKKFCLRGNQLRTGLQYQENAVLHNLPRQKPYLRCAHLH